MATKSLRIHMPTVYGSSYEDIGKRVRDKYTNNSGQTKLPWAWAVCKQRGLTAEQFNALWVTWAEFIDATHTQEAPNNLTTGYQNTYTLVLPPQGRFLSNCMASIPRGGIIGEGSFGYAGNGGDQGQVATEFVQDADGWIGTNLRMLQTPNADRTDNFAYNESFTLLGVRLTGAKKRDGKEWTGWFIKRAGSTSYMNQLQANGFTKGFVFNDGVPVVAGTLRGFENSVAGISCEGTWGADITIQKFETDGSGRALSVVKSADGGNAGGTILIGIKSEDGVTPGLDTPGTVVIYAEGQYVIRAFVNMSFANGVSPEYAFVVNPTLGGGADQKSLLIVEGKGFGYRGLFKNMVTGRTVASPGDFTVFDFKHYASGDKFVTDNPDIKGYGTIPTVPGGGVIVDPPPPATGTPRFTGGPYTTNSTSWVNAKVDGVNKIVITDFTPANIGGGKIIGTGAGKPFVQLSKAEYGMKAGYLYYDGKIVSDNTVPFTAGKKVAKVVLTFPATINVLGLFQTSDGQGGAQLGTYGKVEVW